MTKRVAPTKIEEGDLARLLVGGRKSVLELVMAVAKLVVVSPLGLDGLTTDCLVANIGSVIPGWKLLSHSSESPLCDLHCGWLPSRLWEQ